MLILYWSVGFEAQKESSVLKRHISLDYELINVQEARLLPNRKLWYTMKSLNMTKTSKKEIPNITPAPGYILAIPYVNEDEVFKSVKETDGQDVKSIVLAISSGVIDAEGVLRTAPCRVGDIVISAYSNKEFEIAFTKYRFLHFTEIHGIYGSK